MNSPWMNCQLQALKLTQSLKYGGWKAAFLLRRPIYRCKLLVSGRAVFDSVQATVQPGVHSQSSTQNVKGIEYYTYTTLYSHISHAAGSRFTSFSPQPHSLQADHLCPSTAQPKPPYSPRTRTRPGVGRKAPRTCPSNKVMEVPGPLQRLQMMAVQTVTLHATLQHGALHRTNFPYVASINACRLYRLVTQPSEMDIWYNFFNMRTAQFMSVTAKSMAGCCRPMDFVSSNPPPVTALFLPHITTL